LNGKTRHLWFYVKGFFRRADILLLALCFILFVFGLVVISSATANTADGSGPFLRKQIICMGIGLFLFVVLTVLDVDLLADKWLLLTGISALFLLILIPFGVDDGTGNKSWISVPGLGSVQPSEIVKVIYIVLMAKHISFLKEYKRLNHVFSVVQLAVHFVIPFGMIILITGDLGSALIFFFIFLVMLFVAGVKTYWFLLGFALIAAGTPILWEHLFREDQKARILAPYTTNIADYDKVIWQANQSKLALASGQFTGLGLRNGVQTQSQANPAQHTDFIFSVVGEELGMIGCCFVIVMLMAIILRCVVIGLRSRNTMSMLVCFGVAATVFFQCVINLGMCLGITPVIGLTLPFVSYGGSSTYSLFAAMGLVSGVRYRPKAERFHRYN